MPSPTGVEIRPASTDLPGKERAKPAPPDTCGFVANVDPAFVHNTLGPAETERVAEAIHYRELDGLGAVFEGLERGGAGHGARLSHCSVPLRLSSSDRTILNVHEF